MEECVTEPAMMPRGKSFSLNLWSSTWTSIFCCQTAQPTECKTVATVSWDLWRFLDNSWLQFPAAVPVWKASVRLYKQMTDGRLKGSILPRFPQNALLWLCLINLSKLHWEDWLHFESLCLCNLTTLQFRTRRCLPWTLCSSVMWVQSIKNDDHYNKIRFSTNIIKKSGLHWVWRLFC